jgi:predicted NBD/HSP70 family sugar kinase
MSSRALGLELSDSVVRAVIVDDTGRVTWRGEGSADPRSVAAQLKPAVKEAGGVAVAGVAHYGDVPEALQRAVSDASGVELRAAGAGIAAATAETWCGAAQGLKHVVALTLGDHIAAGVILNGAPWSGAHGLAGSAAWLAINPVERQDYRRRGSLDAEISARGIARRLVWRIESGDRSSVLETARTLEAITATHVFDGAREPDGVALSVVRDTAKYIGMAIANLIATVDPEMTIIGGAIARAGDLLLEPVRQECARRLSPALTERLRIEISPLGSEAAAIGAARLARG